MSPSRQMPNATAAVVADSPFRPVDWRWLRARHLAAQSRHPNRRDDALMRLAVRYLRALGHGRGRHPARADRALRHVHAAWGLHNRDDRIRLLVQARLLAGQRPDEIAALTGLTPAVVTMYAALFYDIVGHLRATDWIVTRAIDRWASGPAAPSRAEVLLKLMAFAGGPLVLDAVLPHLLGEQTRPMHVSDLSMADACLAHRIRNMLALAMLPDDAHTNRHLFLLHLDILATDRQGDAGKPREAFWAEQVAEAIRSTDFSAAVATIEPARPEPSATVCGGMRRSA